MAVRLSTSRAARLRAGEVWVGVNLTVGLDPDCRIAGIGPLLAQAMDETREEWLTLGRELSRDPSAELAHAPSCAGNASDLGVMLAWAKLVAGWARDAVARVVVVDDPWLYRHFACLSGVAASSPPLLWPDAIRLALRGALARTKAMLTAGIALAMLRAHVARHPPGASALLVYGHPASMANGIDGYFGSLMEHVPGLVRALHVDCGPARARVLARDLRTASLHAWGPWSALPGLWRARWRPSRTARAGSQGWLVRRAAAREGATAQGAMIRWQQACQRAWLAVVRPRVVSWPWENHGWERDFVRHARGGGIVTVGYQHATIGRQEMNYAPSTNRDGMASVPDRILASGPAGAAILGRLGYPAGRVAVGGAWRARSERLVRHDPAAPVFAALPFEQGIAAEMVAAIRPLGAQGREFHVKPHPMTPHEFAESAGVHRTEEPLERQPALAGVIYAATSVGLEAMLHGLPTLQFVPEATVAVDILPDGISIPTVTAQSLGAALESLSAPPIIAPESIFSRPDVSLWRAVLLESAK